MKGRKDSGAADFFEKIWPNDTGCWIWIGSLAAAGYGHLGWNGKMFMAHRIAYVMLVGPIPTGLDLDHLCRVPACVNPQHLEPVTRRENLLRGIGPAAKHARQTHCHRGHPFDKENTIRVPKGRACRACSKLNKKKHGAKLRAATAARRIASHPAVKPVKDNPTISCACGCGSSFLKFDSSRRPRRFVSGHNFGSCPAAQPGGAVDG